MAFMKRCITAKIDWLSIDGNSGTYFMPLDDVFNGAKEAVQTEIDAMNDEADYAAIGDYYENGPDAIHCVEIVSGHGCRLSAPGYLDCTEWAVFDTERECLDYLDEYYPEDEDTEED